MRVNGEDNVETCEFPINANRCRWENATTIRHIILFVEQNWLLKVKRKNIERNFLKKTIFIHLFLLSLSQVQSDKNAHTTKLLLVKIVDNNNLESVFDRNWAIYAQ